LQAVRCTFGAGHICAGFFVTTSDQEGVATVLDVFHLSIIHPGIHLVVRLLDRAVGSAGRVTPDVPTVRPRLLSGSVGDSPTRISA
jgi:hypothetical protein